MTSAGDSERLQGSIGPYRLERRLAAGGMAELYLARYTTSSGVENRAVVKRVLPNHASDEEFSAMFRDEARIMASLQHPNIVHVLDVGGEGPTQYIAMEYLEGTDLRGLIRFYRHHGRQVPLSVAIHVVIRLCAALHYAHERKDIDGNPLSIVHRDVTPQNIFLTLDGGVKLVDFGIARAAHRLNHTRKGMVKGKISYMAPEQCLAGKLDHRADVYAIGVILYELTTGARPISGRTEFELMQAVVDGVKVRPSDGDPSYPRDLEGIVMHALARHANERTSSAREVQSALEAFARNRKLDLSSLSLAEVVQAVADKGEPPAPLDDEEFVEGDSHVGLTRERNLLASFAIGDARVEMREKYGYLVAQLSGRLNESFRGADLATHITGNTVLDASGIERITSFGVREWIQFRQASEANGVDVYLVRCAEALTNQLTMMKGLVGKRAHVVSLRAPFMCAQCGPFQATVDLEYDGRALGEGRAPERQCPECGREAEFDDDPSVFFSTIRSSAVAIPGDVRRVANELEADERPEPISKRFEGVATRVLVRTGLLPSIRWERILDGLEGDVTLEFRPGLASTPEGCSTLLAAITKSDSIARPLPVENAPAALVKAPIATLLDIRSLVLRGVCPACAATRPLVLSREEGALVQRGAPAHACRRCGAALQVEDPERTIDAWLVPAALPPAPVAAPAPAVGPLPVEVPAQAKPRFALPVAAAAAGALLLGIAGYFGFSALGAPVEAPSTGLTAPSPGVVPAPAAVAWTRIDGVVLEGPDVLAVAHGMDAEEQARALLLRHLAHARGASLSEPDAVLAARTRENLPTIQCESVPVDGVNHVRCRLPEGPAVQGRSRLGVTLATVAPWLEGDARVVVVASEDAAHTAGLRAGDHVLSVNDEAVRDAPGALRLLDACGDACVLSYVDEDDVRRTARITR